MIMIVTAIVVAVTPTTAVASSRDIAATHAYIRANYAFLRATEARVAAGQAKIETVNRGLALQCPKVGAGSPQNEESQQLSYEVVVVLWSASYGVDAGPIQRLLSAVRRLRWSNPKLTRLAQSYVHGLHELATLSMPDICGDVLAWKASGFKAVPVTTTRLVKRVESIEPKTIPPRLLAPYVQPADRGILAATMRLETKLQQTETVIGFNDWDQVLETLGLNQ